MINGSGFLLTVCKQNYVPSLGYRLEPHCYAVGRHVIDAAEALGLAALCAVGELLYMSEAVKRSGRFVEADMYVLANAEDCKVKPAAGDQIVEIRFEKVGVKKTMANYAPLVKITTEE